MNKFTDQERNEREVIQKLTKLANKEAINGRKVNLHVPRKGKKERKKRDKLNTLQVNEQSPSKVLSNCSHVLATNLKCFF